MLTRLKVNGFKNLVNVDVRFGPFTCIAGSNGVGKSNMFDAIGFLSALAELPLSEAARSIRDGKTLDVANLFHRIGDRRSEVMSFTAEMIIPKSGEDDLGQEATAAITFLRYTLELELQPPMGNVTYGGLTILKEELTHINKNEAKKQLLFQHENEWRKSVVDGRRSVPFISTETPDNGSDQAGPLIQLHQDRSSKGGARAGGGRPAGFRAATLPRTVLSSVNAAENRTAVLARREMQSWRRLQLEPAALREPDTFTTTSHLESNGAHLAATLYHLAHGSQTHPSLSLAGKNRPDPAQVYAQLANRLSGLIDDVREVGIEEDRQRELWTLFACDKDGTKHPARALSDGTLRFLALAVIDLDPAAQGVICLEEPENGIHPARIPAMLELLQEIAVDPDLPVDANNPLRQVIINTHSPAVVSQVDDNSLIVAKQVEHVRSGQRITSVSFAALPDTWRTLGADPADKIPRGDVLVYLEGSRLPSLIHPGDEVSLQKPNALSRSDSNHQPRRVRDRDDLQQLLNFDPDLK